MTQQDVSPSKQGGQGRISVLWCAAAGAIFAGAFVLVSWLGGPMHVGMMHGWYGGPFAFGMHAPGSLFFGALCTIFFGVVLGAVAAVVFNGFSRGDRR